MKRNTQLLIFGVVVVVAAYFLLYGGGLGGYNPFGLIQPSAEVALVYTPASMNPLQELIITVQANGTTTDISTASPTSGYITVVPKATVSITFNNMVDSDTVSLEFITTYGSATYGTSAITLSGYPITAGQNPDPMKGYAIGTQAAPAHWSDIKSKGFTQAYTIDGWNDRWGRMCYSVYNLAQSPPASGQTKTLSIPVTITVNLYLNGVVAATGTKTLTGTAVVSNTPPTGTITITAVTISSTFAPLNVVR